MGDDDDDWLMVTTLTASLNWEFKERSEGQLKPVNQDSFKRDFLLIDMLFWEHFLYKAM